MPLIGLGIFTLYGGIPVASVNTNVHTYFASFQLDSHESSGNMGIVRVSTSLYPRRLTGIRTVRLTGIVAFLDYDSSANQSYRFTVDCTKFALSDESNPPVFIMACSCKPIAMIAQTQTMVCELYVRNPYARSREDEFTVQKCYAKSAMILGTPPEIGTTAFAHILASVKRIPIDGAVELNANTIDFSISPVPHARFEPVASPHPSETITEQVFSNGNVQANSKGKGKANADTNQEPQDIQMLNDWFGPAGSSSSQNSVGNHANEIIIPPAQSDQGMAKSSGKVSTTHSARNSTSGSPYPNEKKKSGGRSARSKRNDSISSISNINNKNAANSSNVEGGSSRVTSAGDLGTVTPIDGFGAVNSASDVHTTNSAALGIIASACGVDTTASMGGVGTTASAGGAETVNPVSNAASQSGVGPIDPVGGLGMVASARVQENLDDTGLTLPNFFSHTTASPDHNIMPPAYSAPVSSPSTSLGNMDFISTSSADPILTDDAFIHNFNSYLNAINNANSLGINFNEMLMQFSSTQSLKASEQENISNLPNLPK